jgi:7-keto-8-aminopelargonate synthetase-like enzyme
MDQTRFSTNNFTNYRKLISLADHDWETAQTGKIAGLNVEIENTNQMIDQYGRSFHHFCTTSYLGLDHHPALLEGAMSTLRETGTLRVANSKNRCKLTILEQYETELSELFGANCLSALSCSAASSGVLPLLASGVFTQDQSPLMVFDRLAHYSMNHLKAACADETRVMTCPHNDMDYLEDLCKQNTKVAYVADGAYSMGGVADLDSLLYLKQRYGLFLFFGRLTRTIRRRKIRHRTCSPSIGCSGRGHVDCCFAGQVIRSEWRSGHAGLQSTEKAH